MPKPARRLLWKSWLGQHAGRSRRRADLLKEVDDVVTAELQIALDRIAERGLHHAIAHGPQLDEREQH